MTLTLKLTCQLIALLCFAIAFVAGTFGTPPRVGGAVALGLFFLTLAETFG